MKAVILKRDSGTENYSVAISGFLGRSKVCGPRANGCGYFGTSSPVILVSYQPRGPVYMF